MSSAEWEAASTFAVQGALEMPLAGADGWREWSRAWLPLGRRAMEELERNLIDCPEGTVSALLHSLPALDDEEGDAGSLGVVKFLHHLLSGGQLASSEGSPWQQQWLLAISSLLRFAYLKWVNVPQDDSLGAGGSGGNLTALVSGATMQRHHAFLFRHSADAFVASGVYDTVALTENSVLFSEAFAFVSFCRLHEVDLVLESGVYKGASTEIWSVASGAADVVATDIFVPPEAEARLGRRSNVRVLVGDGRRLLPELLERAPSRRTAVFIDGPKGELAIRLALALREYPQVAFVAIHDMAPYRAELLRLGAFFFSDDPWFQDLYGYLDAPFHMRPDIEAGGTMAFIA